MKKITTKIKISQLPSKSKTKDSWSSKKSIVSCATKTFSTAGTGPKGQNKTQKK